MKCKALLPMTAVATIFACSATIVPALLNPAAAQQHPVLKNVIPEAASMTIQANITAINPNTREITLQGPSGKKVTVTAGPIVRLEMLKVGDTVNAKYYRSVAFDISGPKGGSGTPKSTAGTMQAIEQRAEGPGGVAARVTEVQGLVVGIDRAANSIDVVNPSGGGVYTIEVTDPERAAMLSQVKIGDTVTAVVSEALAVSIEPAR
jgi:Cu/Ag efflux protein CusF